MKGEPKVIEYLNASLKKELTAINQYFLHARMLDDWGLDALGKIEYNESIEEMHHADSFIQRVLFLEGLPNLQDIDRLRIGEDVREVLQADLDGEHEGVALYKDAIQYAESVGDYPSRDLFQRVLHDEENHIDWLETQLGLIDRVGLANYQQSWIGNPGEGGGDSGSH